jgi:hypothetical protein
VSSKLEIFNEIRHAIKDDSINTLTIESVLAGKKGRNTGKMVAFLRCFEVPFAQW